MAIWNQLSSIWQWNYFLLWSTAPLTLTLGSLGGYVVLNGNWETVLRFCRKKIWPEFLPCFRGLLFLNSLTMLCFPVQAFFWNDKATIEWDFVYSWSKQSFILLPGPFRLHIGPLYFSSSFSKATRLRCLYLLWLMVGALGKGVWHSLFKRPWAIFQFRTGFHKGIRTTLSANSRRFMDKFVSWQLWTSRTFTIP